MTLNHLIARLQSVELWGIWSTPFIVIAPWSTLTRSGSTWYSPISGSNRTVLWQYTRWPVPTTSTSKTSSWLSDRLVVSLISGQGHFTLLYKHTRHNIPKREVEEKKNKQARLGPSTRREKFVTLSCGFLCVWLSRAVIRAKFPHSHQERWPILSHWLTWLLSSQVLVPRLAAAFFWPLSYPDFCWLLSSVHCPGTLPSLVFFRSRRKSRAQRDPLTGTHPQPQKRMPPIVPQFHI